MKVKVQDLNLTLGLELLLPAPLPCLVSPTCSVCSQPITASLIHELQKSIFPTCPRASTAPPVSAALKAHDPQEVTQAIGGNGASVGGCATQPSLLGMSPRGTEESIARGLGLTVTPKKLVSFMALRMILPSVWSV